MKLHPSLERQLIGGADLLQEVEQVANYLADLMRQIHGDNWDIGINHDSCFVIVSRDFSESKRGSE
jgi:hypothetical protein